MEAWGTQNGLPGYQNGPPAIPIEGQEPQDGRSECPNGSPDGPWQPNSQFQVLPKANLSAHGSLRDGFWRPQGSDFGGSSINFEQTILSIQLHFMHAIPIHSIPFHSISIPFHSIPFHSIPLRAVPFQSIRFHSIAISLHAVPMFWASGIPESDASEIPMCRFPDHEPPIGLGGMREA